MLPCKDKFATIWTVSTVPESFVTFVTHFPVSGKTNTIVSESSGRRREANVKAIAIWLISYKVAILVVRI